MPTTKKGCNPGKQPKKVVTAHEPTPAQIAERAAEIRAGWAKDCGSPQRGRGFSHQGSYRIREIEVQG